MTRSNPQAPASPGVCALAGYTGSTVVGATDTVPSDGECYQYTLTGTDNVGNTATFQTLVLVDTTGPAGGSLSYADGLTSLGAVNVDWVSGGDPESGVASVQVERADRDAHRLDVRHAERIRPTRRPGRLEPDRRLEHLGRQLLRVPHRRHERDGRLLDVHLAGGREGHELLADHGCRGQPGAASTSQARLCGSARQRRTSRGSSR